MMEAITETIIEKINTLELARDGMDITADSEFADLGMNSLDFIKLIVALEDVFEFEFDDEALDASSYNKISDISKYILKKVK
ncbi:MAG: acyl carrier protein [Oscillospiraceae bacterium]|nr:acyl carrier protein [Oscillospiraceae bacterium]